MTDDIVARLRVLNHHAKKLAENESLHDLHRDALTRCEDLTWVAADEIERIRRELDGARLAYRGASYDRDRMRSERDELRREICGYSYDDPHIVAKDRGWEYLKEAEDDR